MHPLSSRHDELIDGSQVLRFPGSLIRRTGKAKRTRQQQSADLDGYVAALLYPSYANSLVMKFLVNASSVMPT